MGQWQNSILLVAKLNQFYGLVARLLLYKTQILTRASL